jgi:hypothetical protein
MTLRRSSRWRRARRTLRSVTKKIRSLAPGKRLTAAVRRNRGVALAMRGTPGIALGGAALAVARRRRRARLEAELGPPNERAPGHHVAPPTPAATPPKAAATAPNEGAPGHAPAEPEPAEPEPAR